jgi:hypothetical protein
MEKIVVANLFRLGKDGDKFSKEFKTLMRSGAKIPESYVNQINAGWKTSGQFYEIDKEATKKRNDSLTKSNEPTRKELKEKADKLGLEYPSNIKTEKLIELIKGEE